MVVCERGLCMVLMSRVICEYECMNTGFCNQAAGAAAAARGESLRYNVR